MGGPPQYDLDLWQVHETETDCKLIIRTNNDTVFYCRIDPSDFVRSPSITGQYFKCINLLRSGEDELDGLHEDEVLDWLTKAFEPLILKLAPRSQLELTESGRPTLAQYFSPAWQFVCALDVTDDKIQPKRLDTQEHGWSKPDVKVGNKFMANLAQKIPIYHSSEVEICYDEPRYVLIKPPRHVVIHGHDGNENTYFFKACDVLGPEHVRHEVSTLLKIAETQVPGPPRAYVCRLHGVVRHEFGIVGMLFEVVDKREALSSALAKKSPAHLRQRWAKQIGDSVRNLHDRGIIWGDVKPENILIDKNNNAWIIDFGGNYTIGWVDADKAGTLEGDQQALAKIMDMLH